jgi:hypothetical protein
VRRAPRRAHGQASAEYTVVLALAVLVLVVASLGEDSPVAALAAAVQSAWRAFAYAISFSV